MHQYFLEVHIVLCKHVYSWSGYWAFQCKANSSNHSNQQLQRSNNLQISMRTVQSSSQRGNCRCSSTIMLPKRIALRFSVGRFDGSSRSVGYGCHVSGPGYCLQQRQGSCLNNTKTQNTSYGVSTTLMSQNFSGRNVLKHYNKLKQNRQRADINEELQLHEVFKAQQYQQPRTVQKLQYQIKNRMHWVFRFIHLKNGAQRSSSYLGERKTH